MQHRQIKINEETTSTIGGNEICLAENSESYWPSSHQQSQGIFDYIIYEVFFMTKNHCHFFLHRMVLRRNKSVVQNNQFTLI